MPNQAQQAAVLNGGQQENTPRHRRPRHIFRITYCTTLAEWSFTAIAVGALGFYIFAVIDARSQNLHTQLHYKVVSSPATMRVDGSLCAALRFLPCWKLSRVCNCLGCLWLLPTL
jgi:hypothetical protein